MHDRTGKSTLLHVLGGLDVADAGRIRIGDTELTALGDAGRVAFRNRHVGFGFQFHHLLPELSAVENTEMPLRIARVETGEARRRAEQLLERVGLAQRLSHRPGTLSGGEQQRVAVARALVANPALVLADEPTGDLDEQTADALHAVIREMHRERGLTSVITTHNPRLAGGCDRPTPRRLGGGPDEDDILRPLISTLPDRHSSGFGFGEPENRAFGLCGASVY